MCLENTSRRDRDIQVVAGGLSEFGPVAFSVGAENKLFVRVPRRCVESVRSSVVAENRTSLASKPRIQVLVHPS